MRMEGQEESRNVEDVRGMGGGGRGGFGIPIGRGGVGIGGVVVALVLGWVFGINPLALLGMAGDGGAGVQPVPQGQAPAPPADDPEAKFVAQVLGSTETVWTQIFASAGQTYPAPKLRLFRGAYPTACGYGQAAMGPFYCPGDRIVYIDLGFYDTLARDLGAPGEFARAYVIAHEVGHHVQNVLGVMEKVDRARGRAGEAQANALSVRVELQADCFAGVWAKRSQSQRGWRLEAGDIEAGLNAAAKIGDDTLQKRGQGRVVPESFTHGSSAQRVSWFKRGFETGDPDACDTFGSGGA